MPNKSALTDSHLWYPYYICVTEFQQAPSSSSCLAVSFSNRRKCRRRQTLHQFFSDLDKFWQLFISRHLRSYMRASNFPSCIVSVLEIQHTKHCMLAESISNTTHFSSLDVTFHRCPPVLPARWSILYVQQSIPMSVCQTQVSLIQQMSRTLSQKFISSVIKVQLGLLVLNNVTVVISLAFSSSSELLTGHIQKTDQLY